MEFKTKPNLTEPDAILPHDLTSKDVTECANCGGNRLLNLGMRRSKNLANCNEEGIYCERCHNVMMIPHFDSGKKIIPKIEVYGDKKTWLLLHKMSRYEAKMPLEEFVKLFGKLEFK